MRTATWSNIGTDIRNTTNLKEILTAAKLDYTVSKQPIYLGSGFEIPNKVATVKDNGDFIGVVSPNYEIYQNEDAFDFVDQVPEIQFEKAGETHGGLVYIIGKLPDVTVLNDTFTPYVIFQTSHNGLFNLKATITPLRIVCQNQFAMSFKSMSNTVKIRHSRMLSHKIQQAQALISKTAVYMNEFHNTAEELAALRIGEFDARKVIDRFFGVTKEMTERQINSVNRKKEEFVRCYNADDNIDFKGTAWGMVNALTDFNTHQERKKTLNMFETSFMNVTFDTNSIPKLVEIINETVI